MAASEWILVHGETLQVVLFFALLPLLAVMERLLPRRPEPLARRLRWPVNLGLTALNFVALSLLPVSLVAAALWAESGRWGLLHRLALPAAAGAVVTLLVRAFLSFATHWLTHRVPMFWHVHRVHHLDTELDVTTTVRFHPLEFALGLLPGVPIVIAFGLTPWVLVLYELLDVALTLWTHSNLRLPPRLDRVLRYVVVTPNLHRIHHSTWQPETDSNFGAVFPLWDLLLGTFRATPREAHETMALGLEEVRGRAAQRFLWLLGGSLVARFTDLGRGPGPGAGAPPTGPAPGRRAGAPAGADGEATPGVIVRPPRLALGCLAVGLAAHGFWPVPVLPAGVPAAWRYAGGGAVLATGLGLMAWAVGRFRAARTPVETYREPAALVEGGPYRWSRNPMYVAFVLLHAGLALALDSAPVLALLVPFVLVVRFGVIAREERYLDRRFGTRYRAYAAHVRRWV